MTQSSTKSRKPQWAVGVAEGIEDFRKRYGLTTKSKVQRLLGISREAWNDISSGNSIVSDVPQYAKLYAIGIEAANPTTIPPLRGVSPRGGPWEKQRAWPKDELNRWLGVNQPQLLKAAQEAGVFPAQKPALQEQAFAGMAPAITSPFSAPASGVNVSQILLAVNEAVVAMFAQAAAIQTASQLTPRIAGGFEQVLAELQTLNQTFKHVSTPQAQTRQVWDVAQLGERFYEALVNAIQGTKQDRDAFDKKHQELINKIQLVLEAFMRSTSAERDEQLRMGGVLR